MQLTNFVCLLAAIGTIAGCNRTECDRAIERVCACPGIDCDAAPPSVLATLERCDSDEVIDEYHLPVCISESEGYCAAARAMLAQDSTICSLDCNVDTCDLNASCHEYQYSQCALPSQGGAK